MTELWKAWKAKNRLSPLSTAPWESRQEQARFPHSHSSDDYAVEKWKTKSRFPTFPRAISPFAKRRKPGGLRPPPGAVGASRLAGQSTRCNKADRSCVNKTGQLDLLTTRRFTFGFVGYEAELQKDRRKDV